MYSTVPYNVVQSLLCDWYGSCWVLVPAADVDSEESPSSPSLLSSVLNCLGSGLGSLLELQLAKNRKAARKTFFLLLSLFSF